MPQGKRPTVLVVEDEPALRRTTLRILEGRLGCQVVLAERAEEAIGRLQLGQRFDLVISDLHLPDMDGLALRDRLVSLGYTGPFLLVSGSEREDITREHALPVGVPFLSKPWTIDEFSATVRELLGPTGTPGREA
jgi:CheY-like chemotaxis protein